MSETMNIPTTPEEAPPRRLVRVDDGRWLGGVAAGLGRYFDVNPLIYRIAFAVLAFAGGTGILLYLAAWLVMPGEARDESVAVQALREHRERPWLLLGVGLLLLSSVLVLGEADVWSSWGNVWLAAALAGTALVWWHLAHRDTPAPRTADPAAAAPPRAPARPSLVAPVLGSLLALAGGFGLLASLDVYTIDVDLALAAAVALVGAAVAIGAFSGRRVGWLVVLGVLLLAGFAGAASTPVPLSAGVGEKLERPLDAAVLERSYEFGLGEYTLDLSAIELAPGETRVDVSLGIGELIVTVPEDVALEVDARAGVGEVIVFGDADEGVAADRRLNLGGTTADAPVLVLDADVGLGVVEVQRG